MVRSHPIEGNFTFPLIVFGLLILFGLLMVYDASAAAALQNFNDKYYFLKEQVKWLLLGLVGAAAAFFFDYRLLKKISLPLLLFTLFCLLAVFVPGLGVRAYGAHRWINLGFTVFQPSELTKISLIIYLASWLAVKERGKLLPFLLLTGTVFGLVIAEPDMGTAVVIFGTAMSMYFLSEAELLGLVTLLPIIAAGATILVLHSPYRLRRLLTFFDTENDPLGASYHIRQVLLALGSGGLFGLGLGNSRQKYSYLPESTTDSIFAIIGEELGFLGAAVLLVIFIYLFRQAIQFSFGLEDQFSRLLASGIIFWLIFQTIINLASMVGLIPLTGVPLPFISYGGSALVTELSAVGLLANIWRSNPERIK